MSESMHLLAQQLLGKTSVADCDLQEVKDLAQRYPYLAPAQFLLLQKMKLENDPGYEQQMQKAVLYYHHPLAFELFIHSDRFVSEEISLEPPQADTLPSEGLIAKPETNGAAAEPLPDETIEEASMVAEDPVVQDTGLEKVAPVPVDIQPEPVVPAEPAVAVPLAFEPFHTVDYFASQGIKLSLEEAPKDALGKQLKSFTEWLKTMKRLPASEISKNVNASTEQKVQHMAESSVNEADVVTEAMAEVWLKQGNRQKALEVYNKLSLQNPSKRAYFATLIENLKRS